MLPKIDAFSEDYAKQRIKDSPLHSLNPYSKPEPALPERKPIQLVESASKENYVFFECS